MADVSMSYDEQAKAYDDFIRKLVPDYAEFHELLAIFFPKAKTVLDVGCGTGNTSLTLLKNNPELQLTCLDTSSQMLKIAKSKIGDRHNFVEATVEQYEPPERFDAVVSVMVMHNIQERDERLKAYQKIANTLEDGGCYLSVDIFKGETSQMQNAYMSQWRQFMLEQLPASEVDGKWLKLHREKDTPLTLSEQMELLQAAGFSTIEVVHKRLQFAMLIASR